ncbi:MAG: hypothetical protein QE495_06820 [Acidovorax sp.]|uniref:hypothetical protein n=1 Tax=Acidovorax sp. TaxID=1872122 RepID=UPI0026303214|nr:hypothetical protein [Acidovorax sp.]MDH4426148.1 hypothetical protein [Acidovorax sp.]
MQSTNMVFPRALTLGVALMITAVVSGCAAVAPSKPEDVVRSRAQERVSLLQVRDFDKAYKYLPPSYRAINSVDSYRNNFGAGAAWADPKVTRVDCSEGDRCIAEVQLGVKVVASGFGREPIPTTLREIWIQEEGQWWFQRYSNN